MIDPEDLEAKESLPTKEERKLTKEQNDKDQEDIKILKDLCIEFFNDKLCKLDIPIYLVEQLVPQYVSGIIKIHKAKSKKYELYLKAKAIMEEENVNAVEYVDSAKK